jgi:hypothetical protein
MIGIGNELGTFIIKHRFRLLKRNRSAFRVAEAFLGSHSNRNKVICTLYVYLMRRANLPSTKDNAPRQAGRYFVRLDT